MVNGVELGIYKRILIEIKKIRESTQTPWKQEWNGE